MTTTNRAFIKAFRHDSPQSEPMAPTTAGRRWQSDRTSAASTLGTSVEYAAALGQRGEAAVDAISTTTLPIALSDNLAAPTRSAPEGRVATRHSGGGSASTARRIAPRTEDQVPSMRRPLSSFTPSETPRSTNGPTARAVVSRNPSAVVRAGIGFHAGTTIAAFRWPSVCRELWQTSTDELDGVVERLVGGSPAASSLVGIVGLFPRRGCTTTLLSLAGPLAARGGRVVIVDANFQHPQLGTLLGTHGDTSWQDVLARGLPVGDAIVRAIDDNLDLLPFEPHPANKNRLPASIGLHASVTAGVLRYAYDLSLIDLGAFFAPDGRASMLEVVRSMRLDGAIAVAGPDPADPRDLDTLAEQLKQNGCQLLGVVENCAA